VSAESDPTRAVEVMKSFPYYQNYMDLTRMELCAMYAVEPNKPKSIAFLGSGSWPMTSLALLDLLRNGIVFGEQTTVTTGKNEMTIMNFDRDQKCIQESRAFCRAIGSQADGMEFCCADARNLPRDLTDFDVVYLAALVGSTAEEKAKMVNYVAQQMRVGALMIIRSVQGLKKCLYQVRYHSIDIVSRYVLYSNLIHLVGIGPHVPLSAREVRYWSSIASLWSSCQLRNCGESEGKVLFLMPSYAQ